MSSASAASNKKESNFTNLYVKNFGKELDESKLCQLFSVYGTITSCKIQTDDNGQSKGFGFVNFERPEMAKKALEELNEYELEDGKKLYVAPFQKKAQRRNELRKLHEENLSQRANNLCLYISNLDVMVDEQILQAIFSKFGQVTKTHILRNGNQSKGIGFVCFNTIEETTTALNEMSGKWILSKPIYVKLSKPNFDDSELPRSNSPRPSLSYPPLLPSGYPTIPAMFYVPTLMMPPPFNNMPLPRGPPNPQILSPGRYPSPPTINPIPPQFYPNIRMKSDNQ